MPKKRLIGTVKSISSDKTIRVEVVRVFHHHRYRKRMQVAKGYLAHFEGDASPGQKVVIEETRPISKRKKWRVVEIDGKPVVRPQLPEPPKRSTTPKKGAKK